MIGPDPSEITILYDIGKYLALALLWLTFRWSRRLEG